MVRSQSNARGIIWQHCQRDRQVSLYVNVWYDAGTKRVMSPATILIYLRRDYTNLRPRGQADRSAACGLLVKREGIPSALRHLASHSHESAIERRLPALDTFIYSFDFGFATESRGVLRAFLSPQ